MRELRGQFKRLNRNLSQKDFCLVYQFVFLDRVFEPKNIEDLENGDFDDDEKEIEAFKRFCLNSIPLPQKTKVNIDVKNIAFKKK